ncbi:hypothetical protein CcCBS67573_g00825 [Chytriomyces confervae]|uniref:GPI mannosyltransferase 2 n=1 Tax=Chytriomyces confervae TaxID=246404 RepID=A0A507FNT1_9FUNG|nr:hypothetical protein CcCBS67573_g00825 [Chytriomyces confervae]
MYLHAIKCDWLASLVWMASATVRSNGIAFVGFFLYSLLKTCMHAFQYHGYLLYCKSEDSLKRPWCDANVPLLYSFVQKEYWNNGFLRYWTLSQLPNFLLASPMLFTSLSAVAAYWASSPSRFICLNLMATPARTKGLTGFLSNDAFPHVILCLAMTVYCATCMHVQIITRFFTSMPCVYWYLAHRCLQRGNAGKSARKWVLGWFVGYGCVGVVLFCLFYPPA